MKSHSNVRSMTAIVSTNQNDISNIQSKIYNNFIYLNIFKLETIFK